MDFTLATDAVVLDSNLIIMTLGTTNSECNVSGASPNDHLPVTSIMGAAIFDCIPS